MLLSSVHWMECRHGLWNEWNAGVDSVVHGMLVLIDLCMWCWYWCIFFEICIFRELWITQNARSLSLQLRVCEPGSGSVCLCCVCAHMCGLVTYRKNSQWVSQGYLIRTCLHHELRTHRAVARFPRSVLGIAVPTYADLRLWCSLSDCGLGFSFVLLFFCSSVRVSAFILLRWGTGPWAEGMARGLASRRWMRISEEKELFWQSENERRTQKTLAWKMTIMTVDPIH